MAPTRWPEQRTQAGPARWLGVFTPAGLVMTLLLGAAFAGLFYRWFWFQHMWSSTHMADWGHSYFVPFISVYLIHLRRRELAATPFSVFWPGLAPFALGIMAYFFCVVGIKNNMLQGFSAILTLFGLTLWLLGPRAMRILFLPIAYLVFAVTVSPRIMEEVTFPLRTVAAAGGWVVLSTLGFPFGISADLTGNILTVFSSTGVPHPMEVANACSGLRTLVAFYALGGVVAILACRHWWQRTAVMLLALPVALIVNVARVVVLGLLSLANADLVAGEAHTLIGTLMLVPGLGLFLAVVWALKRAVREEAGVP